MQLLGRSQIYVNTSNHEMHNTKFDVVQGDREMFLQVCKTYSRDSCWSSHAPVHCLNQLSLKSCPETCHTYEAYSNLCLVLEHFTNFCHSVYYIIITL